MFWAIELALLVPAAALTFARLVEPDAGPWIRLEAFTTLALALYAGALLLLVVRLLVQRRWRSLTAGVALLALLGLAAHAWWFAPQLTGANPPPAAGAEPLVVMTANVASGDGDPVEVVRLANVHRVDLLVVQEITAADLADMERAGLSDLLPHRIGDPGTGGDATMVFARTALGDPVALETLHGGWAVPMGDLSVLAVHPWAPTEPDIWRADLESVHAAALAHDADLVLGDFNATVDHAPMRALSADGFRDVGELANQGWQPTWPSDGRTTLGVLPVPSLTQIDHVLVGPRMAAITMWTAEIPGSDHRAVLAEVAEK